MEPIAGAGVGLLARLGYQRYGAQGATGDQHQHLASAGRTRAGRRDPPAAAAGAGPGDLRRLTERERAALAWLEHAAEWDSGYWMEQATRPQTIGYALVDSPVALCAWIVEQLWAWTDCHGRLENVLSRDEVLDNVLRSWLPGTGAAAARLYWESIRRVNQWISGTATDTVTVATGCSIFPKELQRPSRRWAAKRLLDIRSWNEPDTGGHLAAFEQPELFVEQLRAFFRLAR